MADVLDFNKAHKRRQNAQTRARDLVSSMEEQSRPHIAIAHHLQLKALEKPFAEVLEEIQAAHEEANKRFLEDAHKRLLSSSE